MRYASRTRVPVDRTRQQIEAELRRYGADQFISGWEHGRAMLGFRIKDRQVRFELPLPKEVDHQDSRARWRALLLVIKAKLEAVESKITTFETEFLAHIVLPNNTTVGDTLLPQLAEVYRTGKIPRLLGGASPEVDKR
jgi:hypothetical protein